MDTASSVVEFMSTGDLVRFVERPVGARGHTGKCGVVTSVFMRDDYLICNVLVDGVLVRMVCEEDLELIHESR